jgi:hypothetical protein
LAQAKFQLLIYQNMNTLEGTRAKRGIFGLNTLVSEEFLERAVEKIYIASEVKDEDPETH